LATKFVVHPDKSGSYRWKLVSSNGQSIATSGEAFSSKSSAVKAAENVKERAGAAEVVIED
jgi:uncharacterized protein YegP (UPF0339 family)